MTAIVSAPEALSPTGSGDRPATGRVRTVLTRHPLAAVAAGYLAVLTVCAVAAPFLAPGPGVQDLGHVLAGPSADHWLGTDRLGRDVLSRLLFGARVTLLDVVVATAVFLVLGIPASVVAGYRGRWLDGVVTRFADLLLAVPGIVVLLMVVAVFPGNDLATMVALGAIGCPGLMRIVRGSTMAVRGELYVKAARLAGLRTVAIVRRHVLPRIAGPVVVQTSLFCATALLAESGLSFLGLTRPESRGPSWGNMVAEASQAMDRSPWLLVPTGGVLMLTVVAFGLIGDAVRDVTMDRAAPARSRGRTPSRGVPQVPAASDATSVLSVRGLTVAVNGIPVIRDVGFDLAPGEAVGIVGESGCGKSMTARAVLGLLPAGGEVVGGSVRYGGRELTSLRERDLARVRGNGIALVSQDHAAGLDPTFTVGSQLREVVRRHHPQSRRQATAEAERLLRLVRLPDAESVLRRRPGELSGGMAQRVCLAMALAGRPKVLIADEPTTALDVTVQSEVLALLRDLGRRLDMAILLITHDWGVLADMCTRAVVMYAGEVVEAAPVDDLYARPRHPYTAALLAANPVLATAGEALPSIPGRVPRPGEWPPGCHFLARCPYADAECASRPVPLTRTGPLHESRCVHTDRLEA